MEKYEGYRGLNVYQKSYAATLEIYRMTKSFPREERDVLVPQMRRAASSIPMNIAEGYGKKESDKEYRRFLTIAKGSCNEMSVQIDFCKDLGYITDEIHKETQLMYTDISKMLTGLIKTVS